MLVALKGYKSEKKKSITYGKRDKLIKRSQTKISEEYLSHKQTVKT